MSKVRINDLARELEVKSRVILDILPEVGVTEKKTHSSSVEEDEARRVRSRSEPWWKVRVQCVCEGRSGGTETED